MNLLFQVRPNLGIRLLASFRGHTSAFTVDMGLSATASLNRTNILRAALAESQSLSLTQSDIKAMSQWAWDAWTRCCKFERNTVRDIATQVFLLKTKQYRYQYDSATICIFCLVSKIKENLANLATELSAVTRISRRRCNSLKPCSGDR
jgi:hypothetical protein